MTRRMIAKLLSLGAMCLLLLGSCMGPLALYAKSPRWMLKEFDPNNPGSFFVAFLAKEGDGAERLQVARYPYRPDSAANSTMACQNVSTTPHRPESASTMSHDVQYHLPDGQHEFRWLPDDGGATINVKTEGPGVQTVRVFVVGDTPWTSLSEYRVVGNKVHPLRHAHSSPWILLGIVACILLGARVMEPIERGIARLMHIQPKGLRAEEAAATKS